jgi:hypothetical protein
MVSTCVFFSLLDGDNDPALPHRFLDSILNNGLLHLHLPCSALINFGLQFSLQTNVSLGQIFC